jgi:hypothetical protein
LLLLVCALAVAVPAWAHPHNYVQAGVGDAAYVCDSSASPGLGGVCIPSGHAAPVPGGSNLLEVRDLTTNPVSATYCQDINANGICGDGPDHISPFCNTLILNSGTNWDTSRSFIVRVHGPVFGLPSLNACGDLHVHAGTVGFVSHE